MQFLVPTQRLLALCASLLYVVFAHPQFISEAAQMKFFRHLPGITKLDKERINVLGGKNGSTEHSEGNKTVPGNVATSRTVNGHK